MTKTYFIDAIYVILALIASQILIINIPEIAEILL